MSNENTFGTVVSVQQEITRKGRISNIIRSLTPTSLSTPSLVPFRAPSSSDDPFPIVIVRSVVSVVDNVVPESVAAIVVISVVVSPPPIEASISSFLASRVSSLSSSISQIEGHTEARYRNTEGQNLEANQIYTFSPNKCDPDHMWRWGVQLVVKYRKG